MVCFRVNCSIYSTIFKITKSENCLLKMTPPSYRSHLRILSVIQLCYLVNALNCLESQRPIQCLFSLIDYYNYKMKSYSVMNLSWFWNTEHLFDNLVHLCLDYFQPAIDTVNRETRRVNTEMARHHQQVDVVRQESQGIRRDISCEYSDDVILCQRSCKVFIFLYVPVVHALRAATNESQKTRNKKQNGLAHLRFLVCVTPKQKKHCLIRE